MPRFMNLFKAQSSAWPADPKQKLALWEGIVSGVDQLLKIGVLKEIGWFSPDEGYGILDAESKAKVLELVSSYVPLYTQQIHEIPPWEEAKEAFLSSARQAAKSA